MKKKINYRTVLITGLLFCCLLMLVRCNTDDYTIRGKVVGIPDQLIKLTTISANDFWEVVGETQIVNGKFEFKGKLPCKGALFNLVLEDTKYWLLSNQAIPGNSIFMIDKGQTADIEIKVDPKNVKRNVEYIFPEISVINHGPSIDLIKEFYKDIDPFYKRQENLEKAFEDLKIDWSKTDEELKKDKKLWEKLSQLRAESEQIDLDKIDYLKKYILEESDNIKGACAILESSSFKVPKFNNDDKWPSWYSNLSEEVKQTGIGILIDAYIKSRNKEEQAREKVSVGSEYLDFTLLDVKGVDVKFSDVMKGNKYVLLDFWASWCGPCRAENPHVLEMYNKYHKKGFEVVAVSLDKNKKSWLKAIKEDGMPWIQLCGLNDKSKPVVDYAVNGIPDNFLIEVSTGKIVAKRLRGKQLFDKMTEIFGE